MVRVFHTTLRNGHSDQGYTCIESHKDYAAARPQEKKPRKVVSRANGSRLRVQKRPLTDQVKACDGLGTRNRRMALLVIQGKFTLEKVAVAVELTVRRVEQIFSREIWPQLRRAMWV